MGSVPKCIDIGNKARKLRNEICDDVSEFLVVLAHNFLYRFGGCPLGEFREYSFNSEVSAQICINECIAKYCQRSAHLANQAMQKNNLETYEVSIENAHGEALVAIRVTFRRTPDFINRTIHDLAEPELRRLRHNLGQVLLQLQSMVISNQLRDKLYTTPTRLRIRLQLCAKEPKRLFKPTCETVLPPVLRPLTDVVRNEFNQLVFATYFISDDPKGKQVG
ncbi:hypothetical protein DICVIV_01371 [Dictyocaulus viviparus]|uniref:Uncharacterized protein n=1 Tax=Dictyocaulus viviparus TaxID=29172 RepID=A0A0D8Y8T5_DICVI|nr:hypothetical protein DICVIV_01371 [Dictyocaulus viviparus]